MTQSDLSVKDRRGAIGASGSRSRLGDSHSETPNEVRKRTPFFHQSFVCLSLGMCPIFLMFVYSILFLTAVA